MIQLTHNSFQKPFMSIMQDARRCLAIAAPRPSTPVPETAAVEQFRTGEMDDEEEGRIWEGPREAHVLLTQCLRLIHASHIRNACASSC